MRRTIVATILIALSLAPAVAQTEGTPGKGRPLTIYIGFSVGGSYDYYGRLLARHIGKHLPGAPTVIVQNMPGAGSFRLANWLTSIAPRDGTAVGTVSQSIAVEELLKSQGVRYKSAEFNWIGRATTVTEILVTLGKAKTIQDATQQEVIMGSTGPGSPSEGYPRLLNAVVKTKFRLISGYSASTEVLLAMEKGEVDAALTSIGSLSGYRADWADRSKTHFLVQGTIERTETLPDVPAVGELGDMPDDRAILQLYASSSSIGRGLIAPPGVPADRVAELRNAFDATIRDPEYIADVRRTKDEFRPLAGLEIQKMVEQIANTPPEVVARMKALLQ